jgi:large subunit ribosomal protein L40
MRKSKTLIIFQFLQDNQTDFYFRQRTRKLPQLSEQEDERRALLIKKWAGFRMEENLNDFKLLDKLVVSQNKALQELRLESEELYQQAIQTDMDMIPFTAKGPVETPPIKDYEFVDGDYSDVTKMYEGESKENK